MVKIPVIAAGGFYDGRGWLRLSWARPDLHGGRASS